MADGIRAAGGGVADSPVPALVVRALVEAGIDGRLIRPSGSGYRAPDGELWVVLGEITFGHFNRAARFVAEVGSGDEVRARVRFTLKLEDGKWRVVGFKPVA